MSRYDTPEICPNCGVVLPDKKINMCAVVVETIRKRPDLSYQAIADAYRLSKQTVYNYAKRAKIRRTQHKLVVS